MVILAMAPPEPFQNNFYKSGCYLVRRIWCSSTHSETCPGLLPISWSSDNGSHLFVNSVDEGSGGFSSIGTYLTQVAENSAGVLYPRELCGRSVLYSSFQSYPTLWPVVRSRSPRGSATRREPCCEMTPRNRSARGSPGATYSVRAGFLQPRPHHLGRELRAVVAAHPTRGAAASGRDFGQDDPNVLGGHASSLFQRETFTSIFINNTQPLETSTITGTIEELNHHVHTSSLPRDGRRWQAFRSCPCSRCGLGWAGG